MLLFKRQIFYVITYIWNLKNKTNECKKTERLTDVDNKLGVTSEEREGKQGKIG